MNYDDCFECTVGIEGGYNNDPLDPGGETKFGISKRSYPHLDIKNLTIEQAKEIYRTDFWRIIQADQLPSWLRPHVFDAAVNSGTKTAALWLQRVLGAALDGVIGPKTIGLARMADPGVTVARYNGERLQAMTEMRNWDHNARGWSRRIAKLLRMTQNV